MKHTNFKINIRTFTALLATLTILAQIITPTIAYAGGGGSGLGNGGDASDAQNHAYNFTTTGATAFTVSLYALDYNKQTNDLEGETFAGSMIVTSQTDDISYEPNIRNTDLFAVVDLTTGKMRPPTKRDYKKGARIKHLKRGTPEHAKYCSDVIYDNPGLLPRITENRAAPEALKVFLGNDYTEGKLVDKLTPEGDKIFNAIAFAMGSKKLLTNGYWLPGFEPKGTKPDENKNIQSLLSRGLLSMHIELMGQEVNTKGVSGKKKISFTAASLGDYLKTGAENRYRYYNLSYALRKFFANRAHISYLSKQAGPTKVTNFVGAYEANERSYIANTQSRLIDSAGIYIIKLTPKDSPAQKHDLELNLPPTDFHMMSLKPGTNIVTEAVDFEKGEIKVKVTGGYHGSNTYGQSNDNIIKDPNNQNQNGTVHLEDQNNDLVQSTKGINF